MPRQQPIAFTELGGRRTLGRELAFSRSGTITLRRRYVIRHCLPAKMNNSRTCSPDRRWVKAACG
jgi:hypothetical protein